MYEDAEYTDISFRVDIDCDYYYVSLYANIEATYKENGEEVNRSCGKSRITLLDENWNNFHKSADSVGGDCETVISECMVNGIELYGKIAIIEEIEIQENLRSRGIGSKAFSEIIKHLENIFGVNTILLVVKKENSERLENFYGRFGFVTFSNKEQPMMFYDNMPFD